MYRRARDPFWLETKYEGGSCARCGAKIRKGERVFYYPSTKSIYCPTHSAEASREFSAAKFDEEFYS